MRVTSLSTDQAPPIFVPLRFFAAAPLFLILAALFLLGEDAFAAARTPALLSATHCLTLGFMAMVMLGATQQILPVVIGSPVPASNTVSWLTLAPLAAGTLMLVPGLFLGNASLLDLAWPLLALAFTVFVVAALISLWRAQARNVTWTSLLLAVLALALAAPLGMMLAHGYATGAAFDHERFAAAHISLALGGWVLLLIVGVSYQVVPMFQLTPEYPKRLSAWLAPALFALLLLNLALHDRSALPETAFWLLAATFAAVTLRLQTQRRRKIRDATLSFFRLGMTALLAAAALSLAALLLPDQAPVLRLLSGIAFLGGFALSVIFGMLYKIVPFLVWFHLFRGGPNAMKAGIPNMKEVIPETWMWWHLRLHTATLLAALAAPLWSGAAWPLAAGLLAQGVLLARAMLTGIATYRRTLARIEAMA